MVIKSRVIYKTYKISLKIQQNYAIQLIDEEIGIMLKNMSIPISFFALICDYTAH